MTDFLGDERLALHAALIITELVLAVDFDETVERRRGRVEITKASVYPNKDEYNAGSDKKKRWRDNF